MTENPMEFIGNSLAQRLVRFASPRSASIGVATPSTTAPSAFERAIDCFAHGHWSEAFETLAPLADEGDREAARIAMLMVAHGPRVFGQAFVATPSQRKRWHDVSSRAVDGSDTPA
jgi:hypothetical protein